MMSEGTKYCMIIGAMLMFFSIPASAQRTISGQSALGLSARYNGTSVGAEAFYSQYTLNGYWNVGITGDLYATPLSTGDKMSYMDVAAAGGYMFRLVGTRNRAFNLYAGVGVFAGVEWIDPASRLPKHIVTGLPTVQFLYGVYMRMGVECFLGTRVALTLSGVLPVNFSSKITMLHYGGEAGIKILL